MDKVICFDLEGPLSPQDNAYEVMGLLKDGHKIFEVLSKYDDILTLEGKIGYEPGDTLSLIVPFLVRHKITEKDIRKVSDTALIVNGVKETIAALNKMGWTPYIISTSYEYHAHNIAGKIGIPIDRVYCTKLPIQKYIDESDKKGYDLVDEIEKIILEKLYPNLDDEKEIKKYLDKFFWTDLPKTKLGKFMSEIKVVGGQRKVDSAVLTAKRHNLTLKDIIVAGDSITDYKMLAEVNKAGGVSVVFNGNQYSIPYATVGLASTDMRMILSIVKAFSDGGKKNAIELAKTWELKREEFLANPDKIAPKEVKELLQKNKIKPYIHYTEGLDTKKQNEILSLHKKARTEVRGAAAKLG